jgi:hypothetical protein
MLHALSLVSSVCFLSVSERPSICYCRYSTSPDQQIADVRSDLKTSDAVFVGKVTSVLDTLRRSGSFHYHTRRAIFALQAVWKGPTAGAVTVLTGMGWGESGIQFAVGERYLVFATADSNGVFFTKWCSHTELLASASRYLPALGEARVPFAPPDSASPPR